MHHPQPNHQQISQLALNGAVSEDVFVSYIYKSQKDVNQAGPSNIGASTNQKNHMNSQGYNDAAGAGSVGGLDAAAS